MSYGSFAVVLVTGAALLALWLDTRRPRQDLGIGAIAKHGILALVLLHAIPGAGTPAAALAIVLGLVLPVLVYVFLTAIWLMRFAQGALAGSMR